MTFKHIKFEDSSVMRSLERLNKQNNPSPPELMKKAASVINLTPTSSLVENILHLCTGLRRVGLQKHAEEIETNFLSFKQAQTLYETSSETGEDLVDQAHPKGSHKLEDVDSTEAIFKTIIDKHLETVKIIEKQPTGKLSEASSIIKAVRIVLADVSSDLNNKMVDSVNRAYDRFQTLKSVVNPHLTSEIGGTLDWIANWMSVAAPFINNYDRVMNQVHDNPNTTTINKAIDHLSRLENRLKPGSYGLPENSKAWSDAQVLIGQIRIHLNNASNYNQQYKEAVSAESEKKYSETPSPSEIAPSHIVNSNTVKQKSTVTLNKLDTLSKLINISQDLKRKSRAAQWVADRKAKVEQIVAAVNSAGWGTPHGEEVATAMLPQLMIIADAVEKASFKP